MTAAERRLIAEWIDLGAQYYNDPFEDENNDGFRERSEIRGGVVSLSEAVFASEVRPILNRLCADCHRTSNSAFNRLVLTGNPEGDFNVTLAMVNDTCTPSNSQLLARPSSDNTEPPLHPFIDDPLVEDDPLDPAADDVSVLTADDPDYQTIAAWIQAGCTT